MLLTNLRNKRHAFKLPESLHYKKPLVKTYFAE